MHNLGRIVSIEPLSFIDDIEDVTENVTENVTEDNADGSTQGLSVLSSKLYVASMLVAWIGARTYYL